MKPLVINAYTSDRVLYEVFYPRKSINFLPDSWKQTKPKYLISNPHPIDNSTNYRSTIKQCPGIYGYLKSGFTVPLWSDFSILVDKDYVSCIGSKQYINQVDIHGELQKGEMLKDFHIFKLLNPWVFSVDTDVPFLLTSNFYETLLLQQDFIVPPGILDFKNQKDAHIFLLVRKSNTPKEIRLNLGFPLLKLLPFTQQPIEIKTHLVQNIDFYRVSPSTLHLKLAKVKNFIRRFAHE